MSDRDKSFQIICRKYSFFDAFYQSLGFFGLLTHACLNSFLGKFVLLIEKAMV